MATGEHRPGRVFVSYRRDDSAFVVGHLVDRLEDRLGSGILYRDVDSTPYAVDYREHIHEALGQCAVVLAVIGTRWDGAGEGGRRIDDPTDLVRVELALALERGIPVLPVLVGELTSLDDIDLPAPLAGLRHLNATRLRQDPDFDTDCDRIVAALTGLLGATPGSAPTVDDELEALRTRLLTADRAQLTSLRYEARALLARQPHHPGVMQFFDTVERALTPPPSAARPRTADAPQRALKGARWLRVAAAVLLIAAAIWVVVAVVLRGGEGDTDSPAATDPPSVTDRPGPTEDLEGVVCDRLDVTVTGAEPIERLDGSRRLRVSLTIDNRGGAVELPGTSRVSFVDSTGALVGVELPSGPDGGWFQPFVLAPSTRADTFVETTADWAERGATLSRILIAGVAPAGTPFDSCTYDRAL